MLDAAGIVFFFFFFVFQIVSFPLSFSCCRAFSG